MTEIAISQCNNMAIREYRTLVEACVSMNARLAQLMNLRKVQIPIDPPQTGPARIRHAQDKNFAS